MGKRKEEEEEETPEEEEEEEKEEEEEEEEQEEAVDPKPALAAECAKSACAHEVKLVEECAKRIEGHPGKDCAAWYFDAKTCIDHCAGPKLFKLLK
jgi:ubiquinol-cytochrome c reductase subunit 6